MPRLLRQTVLTRLSRLVATGEAVALLAAVVLIEVLAWWTGRAGASDVNHIPFVLMLAVLFGLGCSVARYRELPLTARLLTLLTGALSGLRERLSLSLGLDFHPGRHPRLAAFTSLRRLMLLVTLAVIVLWPARGLLREVLSVTRAPGLFTVHMLALGLLWTVLLAGVAVQVPAAVLAVIEVLKSRFELRGFKRMAAVGASLLLIAVLLVTLHASAGVTGALHVLAFAALLPSVLRVVEPPGAPWLNLAIGRSGGPRTAPISELVRDSHRLFALEACLVLCLLAPSSAAPDDGSFAVTDLLLAAFGWSAAWLYTGGALLALSEFNRRRRLFDPAFERSRVIWAVPGPEARSLQTERRSIEAAGWRLVVSEKLPGVDDADLLVGLPPGLAPPSPVPLTRVPPAVFLLARRPGAVLAEAEERDKARRATAVLERLLVSTRPRSGDRGEGTFVVPQCWMVVGLTRDDDRSEGDRMPAMTFGQNFQVALGTRLRRFLHEVMSRAGVDVFYVEDSVTPSQFGQVLELIFERHVVRAEPPELSEPDFLGLPGLHIVLHDVDPEVGGLAEVDSHLTRNAISRARILIVGKDRRDGGDDDGPPIVDESSDSWLRESLSRLFPRLQPVR